MKSARRLFLALGWYALTTSLWATLMFPLSIDELTKTADLIVEGKVLGKTSQRDASGRIYTKVEVQVLDVWKGVLPANTPTNLLTILHGGGTVGNIRTEVSGQVEYTVGEEVVAFLVFNPQGQAITIGLAQGKFHVWQDRKTGEKFAHNLFHGAPESSVAAPKAANEIIREPTAAKLLLRDLKLQAQGGKP